MKNEISWDELNRRMGIEIQPEKTTVTKKVRRIAEWDDELFEQSCLLNAPTEIALTFADYIDPSIANSTNMAMIVSSKLLTEFIREHKLASKLRFIGTGAKTMVEVIN
jgi:adenylosuccinate synthase